MPRPTRADEIEMMNSPERWPFAELPLKQRIRHGKDGFPDFGFVLRGDHTAPFIIQLRGGTEKTATYPDAGAAVDDGWVVD